MECFNSKLSEPKDQTELGYTNRLSELTDWTTNAPDSVDAKCILADFWVSYAWFARGSGYGNTVTQDSWKLFRERLDKARQILEDIRDKRQETPFWFSTMQTIAMGQDWNNDDYQTLVREGIAIYPDYFTLYSKACIYYLPRWHGDNKTVHDFLLDAADRKGGDDGDVLLARGAIALWYYSYDIDPMNEIGLPWPRVSHGMQIICQRYPNSYSALNIYALLAWQANDRPTTTFLIQRINSHVYRGVWGSMDNYNQAKAWAEGSDTSEKPISFWDWLEDYIKTIWP